MIKTKNYGPIQVTFRDKLSDSIILTSNISSLNLVIVSYSSLTLLAAAMIRIKHIPLPKGGH